MPINVWLPEVIQNCFSWSLCTIIKCKATELLGNIVCSANRPQLAAVLAGHLCEFHTKQWGEPWTVPVNCLPHASLQLIVCKSAVDCLKSWRVALLLQDWQWKGTFAHTHTSFLTCTSPIWLLYWLGTCVNFIPNSEELCSVPVSCLPHASLQLIVYKSAVDCLKSWRTELLL
jgi:hypothetical protein